jgi:TAP-like protein
MRSLPFVGLAKPDGSPLSGTDFGAYEMNDYSIAAIFCGDAADSIGATTEDVFNEMIRVSQTVSHKFGANFNSRFVCHRWTSRAVERYQGPFNKKPKNVVLVIGNQADPITPFRSAKLVASAQYLGSNARLIQQWDFGHTSGAERGWSVMLGSDPV